jgi:hypothetical protein
LPASERHPLSGLQYPAGRFLISDKLPSHDEFRAPLPVRAWGLSRRAWIIIFGVSAGLVFACDIGNGPPNGLRDLIPLIGFGAVGLVAFINAVRAGSPSAAMDAKTSILATSQLHPRFVTRPSK